MNFPSLNFPSLFVEFVFECTIRATLLVAGAAAVLWALRVRNAATKHHVWTAVLLLMLILPAWTAWGPKAPIRVLPRVSPSSAGEFVATPPALPVATSELGHAAPGKPVPLPFMPVGEQILVCTYLAGFWGLLLRLAIGTRAANRLVRRSVEQDGQRSSGACAAPVTVGWLRPVVILPEHWRDWPREQLSAVLAHEKEHVRRRDPMVQWVALLNRAVWWFHPAAWWLERELAKLAEESCDEAALAGGHDLSEYAETLLEMARSVTQAGVRVKVVGMAMPGGSLQKRIRQIVESGPMPRISRTRLVCLAAICSVMSVAFAAGTLSLRGQSQQPAGTPDWQVAAGGSAKFDVASVKQDTGTGFYTNINLLGDTFSPTGGLLSMKNYPLRTYIGFAYKLLVDARHSPQLPGWAKTNRYDIEAHAPVGMNPTKDQYRLMMQALLADRFKFAMHIETRQEPIFAMVLDKPGKLGPQLKQHTDPSDCSTAPPPAPGPAPTVGGPGAGLPESCGTLLALTPVRSGQYRQGARNVPLSRLTSWIGAAPGPCGIDRHVTDATGLTGPFDFVWEWSPTITGRDNTGATRETDRDGPSCIEALKQQLGLKLIPKRGPVDYFIVDHVEEPTPN